MDDGPPRSHLQLSYTALTNTRLGFVLYLASCPISSRLCHGALGSQLLIIDTCLIRANLT